MVQFKLEKRNARTHNKKMFKTSGFLLFLWAPTSFSTACFIKYSNGTCIPQFLNTSDEVMNYDHITRQTYRRNSYEQFLLDSGDSDYSFELDFLVFDLCDKHDYLTIYTTAINLRYHHLIQIQWEPAEK